MGKAAQYASIGVEFVQRFAVPRMSKVNLSITNRCNQRCLSCNIWKDKNKQDMSYDSVREILEHNDLMWVTLTGGEPSANPYFASILGLCVRRVRLTQVNSNGQNSVMLLVAAHEALVRPHGLLLITLSVYGAEKTHDKVSGIHGTFNKLEHTLSELTSIHSDNLTVGVSFTVTSQATKDDWIAVRQLSDFYHVGLSVHIEQHSGYYHNGQTEAKIEPMLPRMRLNPINAMSTLFVSNPHRKAGCVAGEYSCWVVPDMAVYPCINMIPDSPAFHLGGLHGYSLSSVHFRHVEHKVKSCEGCWTACESYPMMIWRPWRVFGK